MNVAIYVFAVIGAVGAVVVMTVVAGGLWAVRRDRKRARGAHGGSPRSPVTLQVRHEFTAHGDGGSITDVVKHFEDLYR